MSWALKLEYLPNVVARNYQPKLQPSVNVREVVFYELNQIPQVADC